MNYRALTILYGLFLPLLCASQRMTVNVEKRACNRVDGYHASKIYMEVHTDTGVIVSENDYAMLPFIKLPDSIRLQLVAKLLAFRDDTSLCCLKVTNYSFNGIEGCGGHPRESERYTLQVDALFMINRLCWPRMMELFCCAPVLYDKELGKDINMNPAKLVTVFDAYKEWFQPWISDGRIGYYFPFNNGRYVWYGGRKAILPSDQYLDKPILAALYKSQQAYYDGLVDNKSEFKPLVDFGSRSRAQTYRDHRVRLYGMDEYTCLEGYVATSGFFSGILFSDHQTVAYAKTPDGWRFERADSIPADSLVAYTKIPLTVIDKVKHWDTTYINGLKKGIGNTVSDGFTLMASKITPDKNYSPVISTIGFFEFP